MADPDGHDSTERAYASKIGCNDTSGCLLNVDHEHKQITIKQTNTETQIIKDDQGNDVSSVTTQTTTSVTVGMNGNANGTGAVLSGSTTVTVTTAPLDIISEKPTSTTNKTQMTDLAKAQKIPGVQELSNAVGSNKYLNGAANLLGAGAVGAGSASRLLPSAGAKLAAGVAAGILGGAGLLVKGAEKAENWYRDKDWD
jgi:hypothetical protein